MAPHALTRKQVANRVGLSYANLRIYEKALEGILQLTEGPNRTLLYDETAFEILQRTVTLKREEGWTVRQAARFLGDRAAPRPRRVEGDGDVSGLRKDLQTLTRQNQMLFRLGLRLAHRLDDLDRQYREVLEGRDQSDLTRIRLPRAVNE